MDKQFIDVRDENGHQMFLRIDKIATFKQKSGTDGTEIMFSSGHTIAIRTPHHEFRKELGLDKKGV